MPKLLKIATRSRHESFDIMGSWKFDGSEEEVVGRVEYDGRGVMMLHVVKLLDEAYEIIHMLKPTPNVKHAIGVLETGEHAVFKDLRIRRSSTTFIPRQMKRMSYRVTSAFVGDSLSETTKFTAIGVKFAGMLEWMNQYVVTTDWPGPYVTSSDDLPEITIKYKPPKKIKLTIEDGTTLEIQYADDFQYGFEPPEIRIPQSVQVALRSETAVPLDALYDKVRCFERLLMLATGARMPPTSITACAGKACVGVFGKYRVDEAESNLDTSSFRFLYTQVSNCFEEMVKEWFKLYKKYHASLDLYFGTWADAHHISLETEFSRAVQSLEAWHRVNHPKRMRLKKRLSLLMKPYHVLDSGTDEKEFLTNVVNARDYHAHGYLQKHENNILSGIDLIQSTQRLHLLLFLHLIDTLIDKLEISDELKEKIKADEIQRVSQLK